MIIAINSESLSRSTPLALQRAADLGFSHMEVELTSSEFGYGYKRKSNVHFYRRLKEQFDSAGMTVWSVTAPALTQAQMFSDRSRSEILADGAGAAGILGGKVYVVQPADIFSNQQNFANFVTNQSAAPIIDGFDKAWVQVVNRHMTMALINQDYWSGTPLTNHAERLGRLANNLAIGCALDLHAALQRNPLPVWLEHTAERLAVAYLYSFNEDDQVAFSITDAQEKSESLALLKETRLKCIVMRANPEQSDDEIITGREWLEATIG